MLYGIFSRNQKRLLALFLTVGILVIPLAAEENDIGSPRWYIGLNGGYTNNEIYSTTTTRAFSSYEPGPGFEIAIPFRYYVNQWFAMQTEFQFIQKNYTFNRNDNFDGIYTDITNSFIDIPIMANFSFGGSKLRGFLNVGAYFGVWVNSHRKGKEFEGTFSVWDPKTHYYEYDENVDFNKTRDNRFDAGALVGVGIQYKINPAIIFIEGRLNYGLTDLQKDYMYEKAPRINTTMSFTAGVLFNHRIFTARKGNK
jgi:hypothetical protein